MRVSFRDVRDGLSKTVMPLVNEIAALVEVSGKVAQEEMALKLDMSRVIGVGAACVW